MSLSHAFAELRVQSSGNDTFSTEDDEIIPRRGPTDIERTKDGRGGGIRGEGSGKVKGGTG